MADEIERIGVQVDGDQANRAFQQIGQSAASADASINGLGSTINNLVGAFRAAAQAAGATNAAVTGAGQAANQAAQGLGNAANQANQAAQGFNNAGQAANRARTNFQQFQTSMFTVRSGGMFIWDLAMEGFQSAIGFAENFIKKTSEIQRTMSLLSTLPNSNAADEFTYLRDVADKYGISLTALQNNYAKLQMSAQNTKLTHDDVRKVFEQTSIATRALHMDVQQTQLSFLALEQMLSKGKVSMEELRKQFSQRIPGVLEGTAKELGVSLSSLFTFITKVGAASDKLLPFIGNAVQRQFEKAVPISSQSLDAELNRMSTSITMFYKNVVDAGGTSGMGGLMKTLNELLQSQTVATVFANAVNLISDKVNDFVRSLTQDDIEQGMKSMTDFLVAVTSLAVGAAKAIKWMADNIVIVGTALGAFMGATTGMAFGPWGAAIGMVSGAITGGGLAWSAKGAANAGNADAARMQERADQLNREILEGQVKLESMKSDAPKSLMDTLRSPLSSIGEQGRVESKLANDQRELSALRDQLEKFSRPMLGTKMGPDLKMPTLPDQMTPAGSAAADAKRLKELLGMDGEAKPNTRAINLAQRWEHFLDEMKARENRMLHPETSEFDNFDAQMKSILREFDQAGIKRPDQSEVQRILKALQDNFNFQKEEQSKKKTQAIETQFAGFDDQTNKEISNFAEKFNVNEIDQIGDDPFVKQLRQKSDEINKMIEAMKVDMEKKARENVLYAMEHDIDREIAQIRRWGDTYISELRRVEAEKKTMNGGQKQFLAEWNRNVQDEGKITYDFLSGTVQELQDTLFQWAKTGEFNWKKLTEFVIDYMLKVSIAKAMTPAMNGMTNFLVQGLGMVLGAYAGGSVNMGTTTGADMDVMSSGQNMFGRATGGQVNAGEAYWVGERGPEPFVPTSSGYIHPVEALRAGSGGGGDVQVNVNVDAKGSSVSGDTNSSADLGRRVANAVRAVLIDERRPGGLLT